MIPFIDCRGARFHTNRQMCCNGVVANRPRDFPGCCGNRSYTMATHECVGRQIRKRPSRKTGQIYFRLSSSPSSPLSSSLCRRYVLCLGEGLGMLFAVVPFLRYPLEDSGLLVFLYISSPSSLDQFPS